MKRILFVLLAVVIAVAANAQAGSKTITFTGAYGAAWGNKSNLGLSEGHQNLKNGVKVKNGLQDVNVLGLKYEYKFTNHIEAAPYINYYLPTKQLGFETGSAPFKDKDGFRLEDAEWGTRIKGWEFGLDWHYVWYTSRTFEIYPLLGAAVTSWTPTKYTSEQWNSGKWAEGQVLPEREKYYEVSKEKGHSSVSFQINAGAGAKYIIANHILIGAEVKYPYIQRPSLKEDNVEPTDFVGFTGLTYTLAVGYRF
jgi:opacity protein-like surface antigen